MLILGLLPKDELNTSNVISKAIFHLYTSTRIRLIWKHSFFAWERGFIRQKEADGPLFLPV